MIKRSNDDFIIHCIKNKYKNNWLNLFLNELIFVLQELKRLWGKKKPLIQKMN